MLVEFQFDSDVCIIRLKGRFATGLDSAYLREKTEELKKGGYSKVLADFAQVSYIDSTGIGFLIGIYSSVMKSPNGMFALAGANHRVMEVLTLCKLNSIFPIFPDEGSALEALKEKKREEVRS